MVHKWMTVPLPPSCEYRLRAWWVPGAASAAGDASTGGLFLGGHIPGCTESRQQEQQARVFTKGTSITSSPEGVVWGNPRPMRQRKLSRWGEAGVRLPGPKGRCRYITRTTWGISYCGSHSARSVVLSPKIIRSESTVMLSNVSMLISDWLFANPWTAARQAPLSMGFSRQEYWEWVAIAFFRGSSRSRNRTCVSCTRRLLYPWATGGSPVALSNEHRNKHLLAQRARPSASIPLKCSKDACQGGGGKQPLQGVTWTWEHASPFANQQQHLLIFSPNPSSSPERGGGFLISVEGSPPWGSKYSFFWKWKWSRSVVSNSLRPHWL